MPPFPEWYYNVILQPRVKPRTEFTKFSGQDDTSTVEHIARYLMQLGECSAEEAFRVGYFAASLTGPAFQWFSSLPPQSVSTWKELEQIPCPLFQRQLRKEANRPRYPEAEAQ
jgi:hypothetical protein